MISLNEIVENSKRVNYEKNKRTHPFEMIVSPYFSWLFINFNISPNKITVSFFILGLISAILFSMNGFGFTVIGFILYRLHIILDVCDGEVARYTKKFSDFGKYLDLFTHQIVYPSIFIGICFHVYRVIQMEYILFIALLLALLVSFRLSINSIVYRVNYGKIEKTIEAKEPSMVGKLKKRLILIFANVTGFNFSFLLFLISKILNVVGTSEKIFIYCLWYYVVSQLVYIIVKLYFVLKNNKIPRRDALY